MDCVFFFENRKANEKCISLPNARSLCAQWWAEATYETEHKAARHNPNTSILSRRKKTRKKRKHKERKKERKQARKKNRQKDIRIERESERTNEKEKERETE